MRRILATDFGIWPAFQHLEVLSDAMVASPEQWARLANYLLLYDQIVIPTGNFQILPVLRLMLGEDVFDELLASKTIVLARFDKWFGYVGNGGGLVFFQIGNNPDRPNDPPTLGVSYFLPLEQSIDVALASTNPPSTSKRRSKLKKIIQETVVALPIAQIEKELPTETYTDILKSPYLREFLALRNSGRSVNNLKGIGPNQLTIFNPHLPSANDVPEIRSVLRAGFENFLLKIGGFTEADEVTGDDTTLSILRAKGQRLGFALEGAKAFAHIQEISGVPDLGIAFAQKRISATTVLELRSSKHCQALRDWFAQGSPIDGTEDIVRRYVDSLGKPSWIDNIPTKILRFAVTTGLGAAGPLVGAAASLIDNFLLGKWFPYKSPRLFLKRAKVLLEATPVVPKPSASGKNRNRPCPCGSRKKYKRCCGAR